MAEVAEVVAEAIETQAEEVADVVRSLTRVKLQYVAIGTVLGAAVGGFVAHKRLEKKYEEIAGAEIAQMREYYQKKIDLAEPKPDVESLVQDLGYATVETPKADVINSVNVAPPPPLFKDDGHVVKSVFTPDPGQFDRTPEWDYPTELKARRADQPYVIHQDEFNEGPSDTVEATQATFTWYEGDDVLADERDSVQDNVDDLVGLENLKRFGHGSNDRNIVYIRNDSLSMDFEIIRSSGTYAEEVHGFTPDPGLQHSDDRRHRVSRRFDDEV